jgi:muconate cycloisomerase
MAEEIEEKVAAGFTAFKLKVGADFDLDCERVRVCRRIVGPDAYLKADASGAWEEQEAIERIRELAALGVDAVETPIQCVARKVAKDHPEQVNADPDAAALALARVRAAVPAALIEHVADFDDSFAFALLHHRAVDAFNVAPVQAGSLHRAQRLSQLAAAAGVPVLLGSTVELGIGTAAAVHLGVATKAVCAPSDLVGPGLLASDVVTPRLAYQQGCLHAPLGPGLGVELVPDLMEQKGTS